MDQILNLSESAYDIPAAIVNVGAFIVGADYDLYQLYDDFPHIIIQCNQEQYNVQSYN
jgi:hypothetical protein